MPDDTNVCQDKSSDTDTIAAISLNGSNISSAKLHPLMGLDFEMME